MDTAKHKFYGDRVSLFTREWIEMVGGSIVAKQALNPRLSLPIFPVTFGHAVDSSAIVMIPG